MTFAQDIGAIIIGRNEGERLERCLHSVLPNVHRVIYVDSGSTDGSVQMATALGAECVELDMDQPFTAARARNAGIEMLGKTGDMPTYIQFLDGDCELRDGWLDVSQAFLDAHPEVAVVCGRRRERFPKASVYNRLIDLEWETPVGKASSCGGDALMRGEALIKVGGYNTNLIAGEEPELCVRLRQAGWQIWRLDAEMTWHDAAMMQFSQWWKRARRAGHAYAEGAALHGRPPERHNVMVTRRALVWGAGLPVLAILLGGLVSVWAWSILLLWPAQIIRLGLRNGDWTQAFFLTLGKIPEASGVLDYHLRSLIGRKAGLIEYK